MPFRRYDARDIRNLVLLSSTHAGKTSLAEAMLYDAAAIDRLGSVDEGTAVLMPDPEERARRTTLAARAAALEWRGVKVNLLDTPGDPSLSADTRLAATAAGSAIVVVPAPEGVQVGTEQAWALCDELALPRVVFIDKLDRDGTDFDAMVTQVQARLSAKAVPFQLPHYKGTFGHNYELAGVLDLVSMKAIVSRGDGREVGIEDIPAGRRTEAAMARELLVETVAASDDDLLAAYVEAMALTDEELARGLRRAIRQRTVVPILCGAGRANVGIPALLDFVVGDLPAASEETPPVGKDAKGGKVARQGREDEPFSAFVVKTRLGDGPDGRLSLVRIASGKLSHDLTIVTVAPTGKARKEAQERPIAILVPLGDRLEQVLSAVAGDLVVIPRLRDAHTGDTLCDLRGEVVLSLPAVPAPVLSLVVRARVPEEEERIAEALRGLCVEDPALRVQREPVGRELLLSGMGSLHLEANVARVRRAGLAPELLPQRVPYRETVKARVTGIEGRHEAIVGGRGQFGTCVIDLEPARRGDGLVFEDALESGVLPRPLVQAIERGVRQRAQRGLLAGHPIVDVKVTLRAAKHHEVDSDPRAFELAGARALRAAFAQARPVLLEPAMRLEITCPESLMGEVMGDVSQRRGRVQGAEARGDAQVVSALVPMAEALTYAADLRALTGGRGSFSMAFDHDEELPAALQAKLVAEAPAPGHEEDD